MAITTTFLLNTDQIATLDGEENPSFAEFSDGFAFVADVPGTTEDGFVANQTTGALATIDFGFATSQVSAATLTNNDIMFVTNFGSGLAFRSFEQDGTDGTAAASTLSSGTSAVFQNADVTALANGGYAIAYIADLGPETDPRINFFDASGTETASVIFDNSTLLSASGIKLATLSNGNVVAAWTDETNATGNTAVVFAIYAADGTTVQTPTIVANSGSINQDVAVVATSTGFSIFYETNGDNTGGIDIRQNDFSLGGTSLSFANLTGPTSGTSTDSEFNPSAVLLENGLIALSYESSGDAFVQIVSERTTGPRSDPFEVNGGSAAANLLTDTDITTYVDNTDDGQPRILVAMEDLDDVQVVGEILTYLRVQTSDGADDTFTPTFDRPDSFVGGDGIDTVDYSGATTAVQVDRALNTASQAALGDQFSSIERFIGTDFNDTLGGGSGNDTLEGGDGADILLGRAGVDLMLGQDGADTIFGGDGDDSLNGGSGDDTVNGGTGNDNISGSRGNDAIEGGEGNDYIDGFQDNDVLMGGDGQDTVYGGTQDDTLYGGGDNDVLYGSRDDDVLYGGEGDDRLYSDGDSRDGADTGLNRLFGEAGNDSLFGDDGQDILDGGTGADSMNGGRGNDFYLVDNVADIVTETLAFSAGGGIDTVRAFIDYVQPTNIELVRLGNLTDTDNLNATGNDAPGTLVGNAGDNTLTGRGGNDQINGNDGDDVLIGNTGRDTLVGGAGADTFVYSSISESRTGSVERDVINGFDRGEDLIDLSAMDANLGGPGDAAFTFIGTSGFSGAAGELRLQGLGGPNAVLVEGDLRGDGVADFQIFVNLTTVLGADDFIL